VYLGLGSGQSEPNQDIADSHVWTVLPRPRWLPRADDLYRRQVQSSRGRRGRGQTGIVRPSPPRLEERFSIKVSRGARKLAGDRPTGSLQIDAKDYSSGHFAITTKNVPGNSAAADEAEYPQGSAHNDLTVDFDETENRRPFLQGTSTSPWHSQPSGAVPVFVPK